MRIPWALKNRSSSRSESQQGWFKNSGTLRTVAGEITKGAIGSTASSFMPSENECTPITGLSWKMMCCSDYLPSSIKKETYLTYINWRRWVFKEFLSVHSKKSTCLSSSNFSERQGQQCPLRLTVFDEVLGNWVPVTSSSAIHHTEARFDNTQWSHKSIEMFGGFSL